MDYFDARQYLAGLPSPVFLAGVRNGKILYSNKMAERQGIYAGVNLLNMLEDKNAFQAMCEKADREPSEAKVVLLINEKPYNAAISLCGARYNGIQSLIINVLSLEEAQGQKAESVITQLCDIYMNNDTANKTHRYLETTANSMGAFCATLYEKRDNRYVLKDEWRNRKCVVIPVLCPNFGENAGSETERLKSLKRAKDAVCTLYIKAYSTEGAVIYYFDRTVEKGIKRNAEKYTSVYRVLSPDAPKNEMLFAIKRSLDQMGEGVAVWNRDTRDIIYENKANRELFGYMCERKMTSAVGQGLKSEKVKQENYSDGERDYLITHTLSRIDGRNVVATLIQDITEYKKAESTLELMAKTDALTGLLNRRAGTDKLKVIYEECKKKKTPLTVCFADIDGLKFINDTYGHGAGDVMIKSVAEVLKKYVDRMGVSCRLGGDEFVLILPGANKEQASIIAAQIERETKKCLVGESQGISMSFGFKEAEYSPKETADTLVSVADSDMYMEKRKKSAR